MDTRGGIGDENEYVSNTRCGNTYGKAWRLILAKFGILLVVVLICAVIEAPAGAGSSDEATDGADTIGLLWGMFISGPIGMSTAWVFLKAARKERFKVADMFAIFQRNYWNAVGAIILKFVIIALGLILLIIPGIILACRLAFVEYLIVDRKLGAMDAIKTSWVMTKGHGLTVFLMALLAIPIVFAGLLALVVGVFVSAMWVTAAFAVLYHSVEMKDGVPALADTARSSSSEEIEGLPAV